MPVVEIAKTSFNAGIWSKKLDARSDLARYASACSELVNFIPHSYGGISNRAGTEFIHALGNRKVKLIPFQFNSEQAYVLAFYEGGGVVLQDGSIITNDDYSIYEFSHPYKEEHLSKLNYIQSADTLYITHNKYPPAKIIRDGAHNNWVYSELPFENSIPTPEVCRVVSIITSGEQYTYGITLVDAKGSEGMLQEASTPARLGDRLEFDNVPEYYGCIEYNIYRMSGGAYGWVGSTVSNYWVDTNAENGQAGTDPDMDARPPILNNPFQGEGNYPTCCAIWQGRLILGGTDNKPRTFYGSRAGSYTDFSSRYPLQDDDSYEFEISSGEVNRIEWLRPFSKGMLIGTGGGEYLAADKMTATSVDIKPQTGYGCESIPSVVAGDDILYVQKGKNIIRSTLYDALSEKYKGNNIAMLAEDLFENHKLTAIAWQRDPEYILWCVRDDGALLGLTYVKDEKIWAWHKHATKGRILDIAVISDAHGEDKLFLAVERNGNCILESMRSRSINGDMAKSWFLDSAIEYAGEATMTLCGLDHLEGKTVTMFDNGAVTEGLQVENGTITLPYPVEKCLIGLPYISKVATMGISLPPNSQFILSSKTDLIGAAIYFQDSCIVRVSGTGEDDIEKWNNIVVSDNHDLSAPFTLSSRSMFKNLKNNNMTLIDEVKRNKFYLANFMPLPVTVSAVGFHMDVGNVA